MLIKGKNIKSLQVFSLKQSKKVATIFELICNSNGHKVTAFSVDRRGLTTDARVIPFEDVKSIGEDALVVESEAAIYNLSHVAKEIQRMVRDSIYIIDTSVITEDGVGLGKIADIYFDPKTGTIEDVEITQGPIKDISLGRKKIRGEDIISVGKDTTVVKSDTDEKLASKSGGGLQGVIQQVQEKIASVKEKTSAKNKK